MLYWCYKNVHLENKMSNHKVKYQSSITTQTAVVLSIGTTTATTTTP